jgi:hypothetical protein
MLFFATLVISILTGCQSTHEVSYLSRGLANELTTRSDHSKAKLVFVDRTFTFPERLIVTQDSIGFFTTKTLNWSRDIRKEATLSPTILDASGDERHSRMLYQVPTKDVSRIVYIDHMRGAKTGLVTGLVTGAIIGGLLGAAAANLCIMGPCPEVTAGERAGAAALGAGVVAVPLGTLCGLLGLAAGHAERYVLHPR